MSPRIHQPPIRSTSPAVAYTDKYIEISSPTPSKTMYTIHNVIKDDGTRVKTKNTRKHKRSCSLCTTPSADPPEQTDCTSVPMRWYHTITVNTSLYFNATCNILILTMYINKLCIGQRHIR